MVPATCGDWPVGSEQLSRSRYILVISTASGLTPFGDVSLRADFWVTGVEIIFKHRVLRLEIFFAVSLID